MKAREDIKPLLEEEDPANEGTIIQHLTEEEKKHREETKKAKAEEEKKQADDFKAKEAELLAAKDPLGKI